MAEDVEPIECRCYTLPHRHPLMIGKLPGFQLPFMVTVTQFAVFSIGARSSFSPGACGASCSVGKLLPSYWS